MYEQNQVQLLDVHIMTYDTTQQNDDHELTMH